MIPEIGQVGGFWRKKQAGKEGQRKFTEPIHPFCFAAKPSFSSGTHYGESLEACDRIKLAQYEIMRIFSKSLVSLYLGYILMKTVTTKPRVFIASVGSQQLPDFVVLLAEQAAFEVVHPAPDTAEAALATLESGGWDVILYDDPSAAWIKPFQDHARLICPRTPIILLLDNPTLDQAVDWMHAGFSSVANRQDARRVLELVQTALDDSPRRNRDAIYQDIVQYQADLIQQVSDAVIATDNEHHIRSWNQAATEIYGWTETEAIGQPIDSLLRTEWLAEETLSARAAVAIKGHWRGEVHHTDRSGHQHHIVTSINQISDQQGTVIGQVSVNRDISLQARRAVLQDRIRRVLEAIGERRNLHAVLQNLVLAVEEFEPEIRASVLLLDQKTGQLRHGAAPSLPDAYNRAIDGIKIGPGIGSCGTAAYEKHLVIVDDIANHPFWKDFKHLAAEHGLRACWSQPIMGNDQIALGTFALYYDHVRQPGEAELDLIRLAAHIARIAIEHAQTETDLRESEEKYRSLVESSEAVIAVYDFDGNLHFANEIASRQLQISPENVIGMNMYDLFPPEIADYQLNSIREVIRTGRGVVHEAPSHVAGEIRWYRTSIQPIKTASGAVNTALVHASDVTLFKAAEASLRQSEAQFKQFMRNLPGAVFIKDSADRTAYCNERYAEMSGITADELIGRNSRDYMPAEVAEAFAHENAMVLREGRAMEFNHTFPGPDGDAHWLTIKFPIPQEDRPPLLGAMSLDVTREKRAEESLRRSEVRYRHMFEMVRLPKLIVDPQTAQILDANPAAVIYYGYPLETLRNMTLLQLNQESPAEIAQKIADVLGGKSTSYVSEQQLADGSVRDVEGFAVGIELNGQQVMYCTLIDVTERKRAEIALQNANQELERRVQERTRALEQAKDRIEAIFDHSGDGILLLNTAQIIMQGNLAFEMMFGMPQDTCVGKTLLEFISEDDRADLETRVRDVAQRHVTQRMEIRARRADGSHFDAEISLAPVNRTERAVENIVCIIRDVSERKQALHLIAEERNLLRTVIDAVPDYIYVKDRENRVILDNVAHARFVDALLKGNPSGSSHFYALPAEVQARVMADEQHIFATGQPLHHIEDSLVQPDGTVMWAVTSKVPLKNLDQQVVGVVGITHDITEIKEKERNLWAATERLQLATSAGQIGIWDLDIQTQALFWDEQMYRFHGICDPKVRATPQFWADLLHPDDRDRVLHTTDEAISGKKPYDIEFRIITPAGETRHIRAKARIHLDKGGAIQRVVGVNIDISDQKAAELALRASQEKFRMFVESAPIATVISDERGRIVLMNRAAEQLFGYEREALIGQSIEMLVPQNLRDRHHHLASPDCVTEHRQLSEAMEVVALRQDGVVFPADIQLSLVDVPPAPLTMAFIIDISRRKEAEETLKLALEKEREVGDLKSRFVSMASHQFRTPMAAILANVETLTVYRGRMDDTQIEMRLDRIRKQVGYMKGLMDNMLELARMQAGQIRFQPMLGNLDAVCREIMEDFRLQANYGSRIVYNGPEMPLAVEFDPHLMHHVVSNLIHNALKYSPDQQPVFVDLYRDGDEITLIVRDRGIGIPPDELKNLFTPFYRARNVGSISGTGLGLSITKQAIEAHKGSIRVESNLGAGTVFTVTLPVTMSLYKDTEDGQNTRD